MEKQVGKIVRHILPLFLVTPGSLTVQAQQKPHFSFSYAKASYSCRMNNGTTKSIVVFSEVYGACYQETNHIAIARDQRRNADIAGAAHCPGTATFQGLDQGFPYAGPGASAGAENDRKNDIAQTSKYATVGDFVIATPYSSKCQ